MIKKIIRFIALMLFIYLMIAFTTLHFDFRLWQMEVRFFYAAIAPLLSILACLEL